MRTIGFLVTAFSCAALWAQAPAQISGTVKGQTGAVLPGAKVTATQTDTGVAQSTLTNQTGSYVLPMLTIGPYRLEVALPGFQTYVQTGIVLQVDSNPVINAVLDVGQVSAQVQVQANAAMVETRDSGVGQVIENSRILELPYGRNVNSLIVLTGAATQTGTSFFGVPILDVSGGLGFASAYSLDGAMHADAYTGQSLPLPFPDAVQELKVETSGTSAQHGQATVVHSVTKSGTNALHGDAFEFERNDRFDARPYFSFRRPSLKRNQFGGTLGGPIVKNKLFFFGGYQRTTLRQEPVNRVAFVPTAAMLAGNFTAFASAACNAGRSINLAAPFANNRIDPALYSKAALNIASKLPLPGDPCGAIVYGSRNIANDGQGVGAIDYQWSDKHSLFGRYVATTSESPDPFTLTPGNILSAAPGSDSLAQAFTVGDTYRIGPDMSTRFIWPEIQWASSPPAPGFFVPPTSELKA